MKKRKEKAHGCGKERGRLFTQSGTAQRCCEEKTTKQRTHTLVFFFLRFADFLFLRGPPPPLSFRRRLVFFFSFFLSFFLSFLFVSSVCLTALPLVNVEAVAEQFLCTFTLAAAPLLRLPVTSLVAWVDLTILAVVVTFILLVN